MIAQRLLIPDRTETPGAAPRSRVARAAADRRRARTNRLRYAAFVRIVSVAAVLTCAIVVYLALMANVTRMNYELGRAERNRAQLADESTRLEDMVAGLESRDRLALIAAGMGMHEARSFAQVNLPVQRAQPTASGLAFLFPFK